MKNPAGAGCLHKMRREGAAAHSGHQLMVAPAGM